MNTDVSHEHNKSNIFKNMTDEQLALEFKLSARQKGSTLRTEAIMIEILQRQIKPKQR